MNNKISLKTALSIWREQAHLLERSDKHILPSEMYEILVNVQSGKSQIPFFSHLNRCSQCSRQLKEMMEAIEEGEAWDFTLLKAAASKEDQWSGEVSTSGGKYSITLRRSRSDSQRGVITVQVEKPYREDLEGKSVLVKDVHGRVLLRGMIFDGEVSQAITDIDITVPRFFVEPVESQVR
jgi:hypothetical protein